MTRQRKPVKQGRKSSSPERQIDSTRTADFVRSSAQSHPAAHLQNALQARQQRKNQSHKNLYTICATILGLCILLATCVLTYNGYLETRVSTPFSSNKLVQRSGLSFPDRYWGSYRPGAYFGMKTRDPNSPVFGMMWYFSGMLIQGQGGLRHWCEQSDGLRGYGWKEHDGRTFGVQHINDGPYNISISFVKKNKGRRGGDWTAHISVNPKDKEYVGEEVSLFFYFALDGKSKGNIFSNENIMGVDGYTDELGDFSIRLLRSAGEVLYVSHLLTHISGLDKIKETVENNLRYYRDKSLNKKFIVLSGEQLKSIRESPNSRPNLLAHKIDAKVPFSLDVVYKSGNVQEADITGGEFQTRLDERRAAFHDRFDQIFNLKSKGFSESMQSFAKSAFSNLIGGIGYFYGASSVQSEYNSNPVPYWKAPLYTAVPSRSFFPRGFLWDEGFHDLLILPWDLEISLDIMLHWFDLINVQGWIPREQILGAEALAKVPQEFVVQHNTNGNPPTFFITLQQLLRYHKTNILENEEHLNNLQRLYPRLVTWFTWFNTTQGGPLPYSYQWKGRDGETKRELNPKTLMSGLDDYPRASHPTASERHVDLRCWLALGAGVMAELAEVLGRDGEDFKRTHAELSDIELLNELHWSEKTGRYADYGLHTDDVALIRPQPSPRSAHPNNELVRAVYKEPQLRYVDSHFGYVSLFPFLLQILNPESEQLGKILKDIKNPELLWSRYGLRSLATTSPLYMKKNTEHDPPYWRGSVWININYLACRALYYYAHEEGPFSSMANETYKKLRSNIIDNVYKEYRRTGFLWENYCDQTGEGKGAHPFNGWTALVTLIMAEIY